MAEDRCQLQIRLDNGASIASVDSLSVRSCSEVAHALPESATVWDLSGLVVEGGPIKRQTVVRWLNHVYMALHGVHFEQLPVDPTSTAGELFEFLTFADCIASSRGMCLSRVADSELRNLRLQISTHPAGSPPRNLVLDGRLYCFSRGGVTPACLYGLEDEKHEINDTPPDEIRRQVAEQLEKLLYIGHQLQLDSLVQRVQQCIAGAMSGPRDSLVTADVLDAIFSPRVLVAAKYNEAAARRAWISSQLQQHRILFNGPAELLKNKIPPEVDTYLSFTATLSRDWQGFMKSEKVTVCVDSEEWLHHGVLKIYDSSGKETYVDGSLLAMQPLSV